jgi:hypothetical protein
LLEVYHKRPHRGIDEMMPIDKWERGIMGSDEQAGTGMLIPPEQFLVLHYNNAYEYLFP